MDEDERLANYDHPTCLNTIYVISFILNERLYYSFILNERLYYSFYRLNCSEDIEDFVPFPFMVRSNIKLNYNHTLLLRKKGKVKL